MAYEYEFLVTRPYSNNPSDKPSGAASEMRKIKLILEERLTDMLYGLTPLETDDSKNGVKALTFRAQSAQVADAAGIKVYARAVDEVLTWFLMDTTGTEYQLVLNGKDEEIDGEKTFKNTPKTTTKSGTATHTVADSLKDTEQTFDADDVGSKVYNMTGAEENENYGKSAIITAFSETDVHSVELDTDIMAAGDDYEMYRQPTDNEDITNKKYVDNVGISETERLETGLLPTINYQNTGERKIMVTAYHSADPGVTGVRLTATIGETIGGQTAVVSNGIVGNNVYNLKTGPPYLQTVQAFICFIVPPGWYWQIQKTNNTGTLLIEAWEI